MRMVIMLPMIFLMGKIDFENELILTSARAAFLVCQVSALLIGLYLKQQIERKHDTRKIYVPGTKSPFDQSPNFEDLTETTYETHELAKANEFLKQTLIGAAISSVIHFKMGVNHVVLIQSVMMPMNLWDNALVQAYILGRRNGRIWNERLEGESAEDAAAATASPSPPAATTTSTTTTTTTTKTTTKTAKKMKPAEAIAEALAAGADADFAALWTAVKGAVNAKTTEDQWTALMVACGSPVDTDDFIRQVVAAGADVTAVDGDGWTALHWSAFHGRPEAAEALLSCCSAAKRAELLAATASDGRTAAEVAKGEENTDVVDILASYAETGDDDDDASTLRQRKTAAGASSVEDPRLAASQEMSVASRETTQDVTLDAVDSPARSDRRDTASSPASPGSMLSLDDLSQEEKREDEAETNDDEEEEEAELPLKPQSHSRRSEADRDAKRMETKLQRNLRQQQAHYARQRKLFEDLRANHTASPSVCSSSSVSSSGSGGAGDVSQKRIKAGKLQSPLQQESIAGLGSLVRQKTHRGRDQLPRQRSPPTEDDEDDRNAQDVLRRIKEKARAEFHRSQLPRRRSPIACSVKSGLAKAPPEFLEEMQQQEASNDALRRQLELLRRLQVENNRFRQETRALRERNDALKERDELREREVKRLREEVGDLDARVQRDQLSLAAASQTARKVKTMQKRLAAAQTEAHELQTALQEAREARDQLQTDSQAELADLVLEVKRWKRSAKQLRQQESRANDEIAVYKKTIATLEAETNQWKTQLKEAKREVVQLAGRVAEKASQFEAVETSAAECVERMEVSLESVQKAHALEREKRKKAESTRGSLQTQMERQQADNALLLSKQGDLEHQLMLFQERWLERKRAHKEQLQGYTSQLEEHVTKRKSDAMAIGCLREEFEAMEQRLAQTEAEARDVKAQVAEELRTTQREVEALRNYVETALRAPLGGQSDPSSAENAVFEEAKATAGSDIGHSRREEVWRQVPELQFVQGAICALRNETMNVVHEFQRSRHVLRQQGNKLTLAQERATELEHVRAEDAAKMKELREQRTLMEQAHEIVSQEKREVLKWSEQTCEKNEALEAELKQCEQLARRARKRLRHALETEASRSAEHENESLTCCFSALERDFDALVSMREHWRRESEQQARKVQEAQDQLQLLEREQVGKADEFKQTLAEVERLHTENARELKLHLEQCVAGVDAERAALATKLQDESARLAEVEASNEKLQRQVAGFEQDLPVFATILQLFVLVVQPLILQVSDLLAQKRLLLRENAEFAQAHEQIACIGQVLKEMVPVGAPGQERTKERQRRRRLRRVIIAVFAMNRFLRTGSSSANAQSSFGFCAPLKLTKARRRSQAMTAQPTVIKVLPPKPTLSRLALRPLLERLKQLEITEKVAEVVDSSSTSSPLGNLVLQVVLAIDPTSNDVLLENTSGSFHCQALLERRRRVAKKPSSQQDAGLAEYASAAALEEDVPMVALIRKRILALGKRVEDLHYQRNSLQKENYEFQFQLEQQAASLKDMDVLLKKTEALQDEMAALRCQSDRELQQTQQERQAKEQEARSRAEELADAQRKIEALEAEAWTACDRVSRLEAEESALQREIAQLKTLSAEEEEKADKARAAERRQQEEVRGLKQAAKKAHDLYQKVSWQLEQEVQEKASLQTAVELLKRQQEKAERDLREEKLRELERSFDGGNDEENEAGGASKGATATAAPSSKKKTSFAPFLDLDDAYEAYEGPSPAHRRREHAEDLDDRDERASPAASASPLPVQTRSTASRRSEDEESFLSEWQRLGVSAALTDAAGAPSYSDGEDSDASSSPASHAAWQSPKRQAQKPKSRRRVEIDKVNAAVHDYMDRIDDKLSKMYGIPPSSAIHRSSRKADEVRGQQLHGAPDG
ncbi:hypothetical protein BBJ28_00004423 [Nothophytophthora sp. Chile5]|nr:hypothetical protein BBJ28_00004423 [Nothophytophthora sp. Chile5]